MNKQFNIIQHLVSNGIINLDDFYTVSFKKNKISLQGKYSSDKISDYTEFFSFHVTGCNGFIEANNDIDGIEVEIVFT